MTQHLKIKKRLFPLGIRFKKVMLLPLFAVVLFYASNQVMAAVWTTITQRQGVITNDQNATVLTSHTAKIGERLRVITQVDTNSGSDPKNMALKLQYDKNDSTWVDVKASGEIRPARSEILGLDRQIGTGRAGTCTGGVTASRGYQFQDTGRTTVNPIPPLSCQDIGFVVDTANASANTTYRFRLYDMTSGAVLNTYSAYPSFTTVTSGSDTVRASKSNTPSLASTQADLKTLLDNQGYSNIATDDAAREILQNVASDTTADVVISGSSGESLGSFVSSAGDVNGDGYDDILTSQPSYSTNTGRVYLFYGGPTMSTAPSLTFTGGAAGDYFGTPATAAGDVNGDGFGDIVIGAIATAGDADRGYIYYGGVSMDTTVDVSIAGSTANTLGTPLPIAHITSAGDINEDGYDDVMLGDIFYSSLTGRVFIFFGGTAMNNTADITLTGSAPSTLFGITLNSAGDVNGDGANDIVIGINTGAMVYYGGPGMDTTVDVTLTTAGTSAYVNGAGDVNGDGYDDIMRGEPSNTTNTGKLYIYYGGSSMDTTVDVTMTGPATNTYFGFTNAALGDINGDGYGDVAAGAYGYSTSTGRTYVYYGGASMNNTADITLTGEATNNSYGGSLSSAGDVNGDGFNDLIVGAAGNSSGNGRAYIYYQTHAIDNTAEKTVNGGGTSNQLGRALTSVGDVNGDGLDDYMVGAHGKTTSTGEAYLYLGGDTANASPKLTFTGAGTNYHFGISIGGAGDVNGDGYNDVIVGAYGYSTSTGQAYIYYGGPGMDTTADVTLTGGATSNQFGYSVDGAGDVNGDGYADVIVGAYQYSTYTGRAYVYYGGASMDSTVDVTITGTSSSRLGYSVAGTGDVNGDGYDDVIAGAYNYSSATGRAFVYYGGSSMNSTADVTMTGEASSNQFGYSVGKAGDVNGDGYNDVIVGAQAYSTDTGRAYLYYGGSSMNSTADVLFTGASGDNFGNAVNSAGDVNGDGYADIVIGAWEYSSSTGRAYIYYGSPSVDNTADLTITGSAASYTGSSVASAGDINGDGYADILVGGYGYSSASGRYLLFLGGASAQIPTYNLAAKHTAACSGITSLDATWNGQSTVGASTKNLKLEVYRFGSTNAWETVTTNSSLAANTDGDITGSVTTNLSEYCDGSNWSYWRAYQASGTQTLKTDLFELAFTGGGNVSPNSPSSMLQTKVTGGATVTTGSWTNENQIKLSASADDPDASDTLQLCVESKPVGTGFTGTGEVCGTGVAYSGTPVTTEVTLTGITEDHYHWQARLKDAGGLYSSWVSYGGNAESARDFGVDITNPTGTVYDGSSVGVDATFNDASLTNLSANWTSNANISGLSGYEYSIGTTAGGTGILGWTSAGTGTSITENSLDLITSQTYYFNVRITDNAGNTGTISSNGQTVAPMLTFSTSTSSIDLGTLNPTIGPTASQTTTLSVSTNAKNGYAVYGKATDFLRSQSLQIIGMFNGGSYASPAAWGSSTGFGYHSTDTSVGGFNRFNSVSCPGGGSPPCFAPYSTAGLGDVIADAGTIPDGGPILNDSITITNKASIDLATQQAGRYQTTILYSAYATY